MSNKYYTLIYGDKVHTAPKTKIIPRDSFSIMLSADELLTRIKTEAEQYRLQVVKECEEIKEHAYQEGYNAGFSNWSERIAALETELQKAQQELQKMIIPVALKAAKKIVGKEIELHDDVIVDIVQSNLKSVSQHKKINIYVNKKELAAVERNKPRLKEIFEGLESLSIQERGDVAPGGCIIETEVGIINGQMDHRWNVLEKVFENMIKSNPDSIIPPAKGSE